MKVWTIGYENDVQAAVIDRLKKAGVEVVADVRAVASSRKAGFSKTLLAGGLKQAGIDYVHLRALGTPKAGRQAVRAGHPEQMERIYADHLAEPESQLALQQLRDLAGARRTALLCYEADPAHCHRTILAGELKRRDGAEIVDL